MEYLGGIQPTCLAICIDNTAAKQAGPSIAPVHRTDFATVSHRPKGRPSGPAARRRSISSQGKAANSTMATPAKTIPSAVLGFAKPRSACHSPERPIAKAPLVSTPRLHRAALRNLRASTPESLRTQRTRITRPPKNNAGRTVSTRRTQCTRATISLIWQLHAGTKATPPTPPPRNKPSRNHFRSKKAVTAIAPRKQPMTPPRTQPLIILLLRAKRLKTNTAEVNTKTTKRKWN